MGKTIHVHIQDVLGPLKEQCDPLDFYVSLIGDAFGRQ